MLPISALKKCTGFEVISATACAPMAQKYWKQEPRVDSVQLQRRQESEALERPEQQEDKLY